MAKAKSIEERRKIRELEAKRDKLLVSKQHAAVELAKTRTELAHKRRRK